MHSLLILSALLGVRGYIPVVLPARGDHCKYISRRGADEKDMEGISGLKGYYRRPSRAIEKGGGFFVPGLENEKIRILSASLLIGAFIINRNGVQTAPISQVVTEMTGVMATLLLFVDGIAKAFPAPPSEISTSSSTYLSTLQSTLANRGTTAKLIVDAIIQSVSGVQYVLVIDGEGRALEVGSPSRPPATAQDITNIQKQAEAFSAGAYIEVEAVPIPAVQSVTTPESRTVISRDDRGWTWIIQAENAELSDKNAKAKQWIEDLLRAPL